MSLPSLDLSSVIRATVPRYTSYPTAPHFNQDVDSELYGAWLDKIGNREEAVSIYIHIPFCRTICHYCGCTTKATRKDAPIEAYVEVLRKEIALAADRLGRLKVSHIHWGGGTPNLVPMASFEKIVGDLHEFFDIRRNAEHAIELDPRHLTRENARFLARMGINRASLGVQDLDPAVQEAIGRIQPLEMVEAAVANLHGHGIGAISFDLMYGLPRQTPASIRQTALHAAGLAPNRISLFGYAHVPWFRTHQKVIDESLLPDSAARHELARIARATIDAFGYEEIGIDHFARPEDDLTRARDQRTLRRNFQGYTTDAANTLLGFGASSIGKTPWGYAQNETANAPWQRAIEAGKFAVHKGRIFTPDDLVRADVIEQVLCFFDVDLGAIAAHHRVSPEMFAADLESLAPMVKAGWLTIDGYKVSIIEHKVELARVVASAFDAYLGRGGRHSVAV
ncbi:oxygen-independent coproporphyrinogen III oxidase [Oryzibacter oryziterrae]|uniref:oxygen-independent coproporphyrinogen III oxidase n=1 Tax=Oryzibacter oryziterrae TaxID=2766474 RepID=UPI001EFF8A6E|nr:oxygen-independent coproporphyrinogen III oxidase [Oryzibacter oryziterrae]